MFNECIVVCLCVWKWVGREQDWNSDVRPLYLILRVYDLKWTVGEQQLK